ncbi:MAG: hypothetical protein FJ304_03370 [Planctomycetes bacterium]|nr:hypothetical protein [Planctomycetota bacterium]
MTNLIGQLTRWRFVERAIRLAWGAGRWVAICGAVLAVACAVDWLADRYLGSESWRKFRTSTWVFAPRAAAQENWDPNAIMDETPKWLRYGMSLGQLALAGALAFYLIVRPWRRTPPVDELASSAEKAIPEFGHRLVTAVQLNRPEARTQGMSKTLIAEVTREAGELSARHNLLKLVNYNRLAFALAAALPVLVGWGAFAAVKPELAGVLLKRQAFMSVEIPRTIHLKSVTQEVWPSGAEVTIRYHVTGDYDTSAVGRLRVEPVPYHKLSAQSVAELKKKLPDLVGDKLDKVKDKELPRADLETAITKLLAEAKGEEHRDAVLTRVETVYLSEEYYDLKFEKEADGGGAYFATKLPAGSRDFGFRARLGNGRSREPGKVIFEAPPAADEIEAWQILPRFLGTKPDGSRYERQGENANRGEVLDALPRSDVQIQATFTKPVTSALLVPIERDGGRERRLAPVAPPPGAFDTETRKRAAWRFPTSDKTIAYELELVDDRGFPNAVAIRRVVRMLEDRAPVVAFLPETTRHPDPTNEFEGNLKHKVDYEWGDKMPLPEGGRVMVIYHAKSEQGISRANLRYRVIPRGVAVDSYPEWFRDIQHPAQDPEAKVFDRLTLTPITADLKTVGNYVLDLGLFEKSWQGLSREARFRENVEFYSFPSPFPDVPAGLDAGGRYMFEVDRLTKYIPDPDDPKKVKVAKLEIGDTVELFVEAYDKNPGRALPGYTKEARRKLVVTSDEAYAATKMRDEQNRRLQDKLRDLTKDQQNVFKVDEPKKEPKDEPKK